MTCCNFYFKRPCKILPARWTMRGLESKRGDPSEAPGFGWEKEKASGRCGKQR